MQFINYFFATLHPAVTFLTTHAMLRYTLIGGILTLLAVFLLVYAKQQKSPEATTDIQQIAGADITATQLDLAKAYLEMGQKKLAKYLLRQTIKQGGKHDKTRARQLMKSL